MDSFFQLLNLYWRDLLSLEQFNQLDLVMANRLIDPVIYPRILLRHISASHILSLSDVDFAAILSYFSRIPIDYPDLEPIEIDLEQPVPMPAWAPEDPYNIFFQIHTTMANFFQHLIHVMDQPGNNNPENMGQHVARTINYDESTHNGAIERSVALSIENLQKNHPQNLTVIDDYIDLYFRLLRVRLIRLISDGPKREAAIRCLVRVITTDYSRFPAYCGIHLPNLISMVYLQIEFRQYHADQNQAISALGQALYEIQRGKNLDENGFDDGLSDSPICLKGSYHKIIECMVGVLPECNLNFMTVQTASLKLPVIVNEHLTNWFGFLINSGRMADLAEFFYLMSVSKQDILELLWPRLVAGIKHRFFDEFAELFIEEASNESINFNQVIETGLYAHVEDYPDYRRELQYSSSYHESLRAVMCAGPLFARKTSVQQKQMIFLEP